MRLERGRACASSTEVLKPIEIGTSKSIIMLCSLSKIHGREIQTNVRYPKSTSKRWLRKQGRRHSLQRSIDLDRASENRLWVPYSDKILVEYLRVTNDNCSVYSIWTCKMLQVSILIAVLNQKQECRSGDNTVSVSLLKNAL